MSNIFSTKSDKNHVIHLFISPVRTPNYHGVQAQDGSTLYDKMPSTSAFKLRFCYSVVTKGKTGLGRLKVNNKGKNTLKGRSSA